MSEQYYPAVELPDQEILSLFEEITRDGDLRILRDMDRNEDGSTGDEPTLEDIYDYLVEKGYSKVEIEELHHLIKDSDGMIFTLNEENFNKSVEGVYEV